VLEKSNPREDDFFGQALLGEGQALRELVAPLVHAGVTGVLPHAHTGRRLLPGCSGARAAETLKSRCRRERRRRGPPRFRGCTGAGDACGVRGEGRRCKGSRNGAAQLMKTSRAVRLGAVSTSAVSSAIPCLSVAEDADGSELQEQRVCWACLGLRRSRRLNTCQRSVPGLAAVKPHTPPVHRALQSTRDQSVCRKSSRRRVVVLSCGAVVVGD
jgi:hypothetical protein